MKPLAGQAVRFLLSGAANTALTYAIYLVLLPALDYQRAYAVAFISGIVFSYALNVRFVFRVRPSWRSAVLFPLVYLVQYLVGLAVLHIAIERVGIAREYALLASIAASIPVTFVCSRWLLHRKPATGADATSEKRDG